MPGRASGARAEILAMEAQLVRMRGLGPSGTPLQYRVQALEKNVGAGDASWTGTLSRPDSAGAVPLLGGGVDRGPGLSLYRDAFEGTDLRRCARVCVRVCGGGGGGGGGDSAAAAAAVLLGG